MNIYLKNHNFDYEIENICRLFFPNEKFIAIKDDIKDNLNPPYVYTERKSMKDNQIIYVKVNFNNKEEFNQVYVNNSLQDLDNECERKMAIQLFLILSKLTSLNPPWGILTGIRPVKLMRKLIEEMGRENTLSYFKNEFLVNDDKINLCIKTLDIEQKVLNLSSVNSFSLYISIPFCPSRCSYCSFVSQSIEKAAKLIPDYIDLLCEEIKYTAKISKSLDLKLETVYIGGGTPTTLSSFQLEKLISNINICFDMKSCMEFTIEAGRPDTITVEKLLIMKQGGVTRISINPQTLNDKVLNIIGRNHTSKQTLDLYNLTRELGFKNINMDLIAGLPCDNYSSFCNTLDKIIKLTPQSITVHTLSMKKASNLTVKGEKLNCENSKIASQMLDFSIKRLTNNHYLPYYLYRQTRMVGNLENVGWSKSGYEGLYNIYVMDETHTILSCGAGAVTKLKDPNSDYLERIFNFKFPYEYIYQFKEMIRRKEQVKLFYDKL